MPVGCGAVAPAATGPEPGRRTRSRCGRSVGRPSSSGGLPLMSRVPNARQRCLWAPALINLDLKGRREISAIRGGGRRGRGAPQSPRSYRAHACHFHSAYPLALRHQPQKPRKIALTLAICRATPACIQFPPERIRALGRFCETDQVSGDPRRRSWSRISMVRVRSSLRSRWTS